MGIIPKRQADHSAIFNSCTFYKWNTIQVKFDLYKDFVVFFLLDSGAEEEYIEYMYIFGCCSIKPDHNQMQYTILFEEVINFIEQPEFSHDSVDLLPAVNTNLEIIGYFTAQYYL